SKMFRRSMSQLSLTQSNRLIPTVMVRISSCSVRTISMVSSISSPEKLSCLILPLDAMHRFENLLPLDLHLYREFGPFLAQIVGERLERNRRCGQVHHHDHREEFANDRLTDVENVDIGIRDD